MLCKASFVMLGGSLRISIAGVPSETLGNPLALLDMFGGRQFGLNDKACGTMTVGCGFDERRLPLHSSKSREIWGFQLLGLPDLDGMAEERGGGVDSA